MIDIKKLLKQKKTKIVGTISTFKGLRFFSQKKVLPCDLIEVRLDKIGAHKGYIDFCRQFKEKDVPVILTIRPKKEGGNWEGEENERMKIFQTASDTVSIIDIELSSKIINKIGQIKSLILVSYHNFKITPSVNNLSEIFFQAKNKGADVVKIATIINKSSDIQILLKFLTSLKDEGPICVIGMGNKGKITRTLFSQYGSVFTYGYLDKPVAPGQMSCGKLMEEICQRLEN
jgi:3-dehydroquinate dehydratase-1